MKALLLNIWFLLCSYQLFLVLSNVPTFGAERIISPALKYVHNVKSDFGKSFEQDSIYNRSTEATTQELNENGKKRLIPSIFDVHLKNLSLYLPNLTHPKISDECRKEIEKIYSVLRNLETYDEKKHLWIIKMIDSWGRYEGGVLQGNRFALGFFDECLSININSEQQRIYGRYCLVQYGFPGDAPPMYYPKLRMINSLLFYGTCVPSSCTKNDLWESLSNALSVEGQVLNKLGCQSNADEKVFEPWNIFGIILFSFFGLILVVASLADQFLNHYSAMPQKINKMFPYLLIFSVPSNIKKIFHLQTRPNSDVISCLHGIRFLSITWVVLGHQYAFTILTSSNLPAQITQPFLFQLISNADKSVDTFFVLSGILVSYHFFRNIKETESFPVFQYYLHRIIRLAPPILICVLFFASISGLLVTGPQAETYKTNIVDSCQTYWWLDWTFFSNFITRFGTDIMEKTGENMNCLGQCWYVSVDTQLYMVMPLVLLPLLYWRKKGLVLLGLWVTMSFIIPSLITGLNDPILSPQLLAFNSMESFQKIYMMPYCRASPYLIGIWTGYLLWKTTGTKITLKKSHVIFGWTSATIVALFVMFGLYPFNQVNLADPNNPTEMSPGYAIFYTGFQRGLWGACVAWVTIACQWGYGGLVNDFLSYTPFQPVSRLTYSIYLVSLPLQYLISFSVKRPPYFSNLNKIIETCGILFISGIGGLVLSLTIESPIINLQKIIMKKKEKPVASAPKIENFAENEAVDVTKC